MKAMKLVALTAAVVAAAAPWTAGTQSKPSGHARVQSVFVSVTDRSGPVLNLGPADFEITERGAIRPVIRASLATSPMRVALLIDTSDGAAAALNAIRTSLAEFLTALPPQHEVQTAGGLYDFMNTSNALPVKLAAIGERMSSDFEKIQTKYEMAFETDSADAGPVSIGVKREGVMLQMSN